MIKQVLMVAAVILLVARSAVAENTEPALMLCAKGRVAQFYSADLLELDSGEKVRLMMVQSPRMPQGTETGAPWPMAEQIVATMKAHFTGKQLSFHCLERARNRHGELVALAKAESGEVLQGMMIERGWARVYSTSDFSYNAAMFYTLEDEARRAERGLWGYDSYSLRDAAMLDDQMGRFEVVEGRVQGVATVKNITYLNFGDDWRKDFTLIMDWRARRLFEKAGLAAEVYTGRRIQVRGWLSWRGGPMMELTHPAQIRLLEENGAP